MHAEMRQVKEEGGVFVLLDKLQCLLAEAVREVLTVPTLAQGRNLPGRKVAPGWLGSRRSGDIPIKAVFLGIVGLIPKVPLAYARGGVARVLEGSGQSPFGKGKMLGPFGHEQLRVRWRQTR